MGATSLATRCNDATRAVVCAYASSFGGNCGGCGAGVVKGLLDNAESSDVDVVCGALGAEAVASTTLYTPTTSVRSTVSNMPASDSAPLLQLLSVVADDSESDRSSVASSTITITVDHRKRNKFGKSNTQRRSKLI